MDHESPSWTRVEKSDEAFHKHFEYHSVFLVFFKYIHIYIYTFVLKFGWILLKNVNFECWQSKCSWRITECYSSVLALLAGFSTLSWTLFVLNSWNQSRILNFHFTTHHKHFFEFQDNYKVESQFQILVYNEKRQKCKQNLKVNWISITITKNPYSRNLHIVTI
jgi:hypothetical protein